MATYNKFQPYSAALHRKQHDWSSDEFIIALVADANAPAGTEGQLSQLTQISYTNCSSRVLTRTSEGEVGGVYKVVFEDLVLTGTGGSFGPFKHVVLLNNTHASKLVVGWWSYATDTTVLENEPFTIDLSQVNGVFQMA